MRSAPGTENFDFIRFCRAAFPELASQPHLYQNERRERRVSEARGLFCTITAATGRPFRIARQIKNGPQQARLQRCAALNHAKTTFERQRQPPSATNTNAQPLESPPRLRSNCALSAATVETLQQRCYSPVPHRPLPRTATDLPPMSRRPLLSPPPTSTQAEPRDHARILRGTRAPGEQVEHGMGRSDGAVRGRPGGRGRGKRGRGVPARSGARG